ncbi:MAG TPA: arginine deiminase-related protein [Saprospiraceae bacterium]|nr:arginine deiminase-related protein [Saprospiraceae bacterium]
MKSQITDTIMMIRPKHFGYNEETAANNTFQNLDVNRPAAEISKQAISEFDQMVSILREAGVMVEVVEDEDHPAKPDSVFPNNWISFHQDGKVITYPMFSKVRRLERREDIVEKLAEKYNLERRYSFEYYEEEGLYLEGTGSMVLDRPNAIVYACRSARTDVHILDKWSILNDYRAVIFDAEDRKQVPIYHTNVLMALGENFVVICMEAIMGESDRKKLIQLFNQTEKEMIEISFDQMEKFAGNMLQVKGTNGSFLVMSTQAYQSLNENQINRLSSKTQILHSDIKTIETFGGGSVRCMMAEVFYPGLKNIG